MYESIKSALHGDKWERIIEIVKRLLRELKVRRYAIVGANAINTMVDPPRQTHDLDLLLPRRDADRLSDALVAEGFEARDIGAAWRLRVAWFDPKKPVVDLMRRESHPLFEAIMKTEVREKTVPSYGKAPTITPEAAIAMKFMAAVGTHRGDPKKLQDLTDMFKVIGAWKGKLREQRVDDLVAMIYPGALAEFKTLRDDWEAGRPMTI